MLTPRLTRWREFGAILLVPAASLLFILWMELPAGSRVTRGNFNRVQMGMTFGQVEAILGLYNPSAEGPESCPDRSQGCHDWKNGSTRVTVQFQHGRVVGKGMGGDFVDKFKWYWWRITGWDLN
jgi:hypothetical protein